MGKKATNKIVTLDYLKGRAEGLIAAGFNKSKWITFCEEMMRLGFTVELYEARQTKSKYCTVMRNGKRYKVRFSDHKPIYHREMKGDCDFFCRSHKHRYQDDHRRDERGMQLLRCPAHRRCRKPENNRLSR
jgi:hypothetical protein